MRKKVIGIPGAKYKDEGFGAGINHLEFISKFGYPRIIMPWEEFVGVDMLYLPGGLDTNPVNYGEVPGFKTSNQDVFKEFFFQKRLKNYVDIGIPIFGVCLGAQMLAVYFGGKLTQNLLCHAQSPGRWEEAHSVYGTDELLTSPYHFNNGKRAIKVNSHHHQALTDSGLSRNIIPLYTADNENFEITNEVNIIEAFMIKDKNIVGVQWHPEELYDVFSCKVIKSLLK